MKLGAGAVVAPADFRSLAMSADAMHGFLQRILFDGLRQKHVLCRNFSLTVLRFANHESLDEYLRQKRKKVMQRTC